MLLKKIQDDTLSEWQLVVRRRILQKLRRIMEHAACENLHAVVEHADLGRGGTGIDDKHSHATNGTPPTRLEVKLGRMAEYAEADSVPRLLFSTCRKERKILDANGAHHILISATVVHRTTCLSQTGLTHDGFLSEPALHADNMFW